MQTKTHSFYEALSNTAIGFLISLAATFVIFPLVGLPTSPGQNLAITCFYTVISIVRGYVIRRWFNNNADHKAKRSHRYKRHCYYCEKDMFYTEKDGDTYCMSCGNVHEK